MKTIFFRKFVVCCIAYGLTHWVRITKDGSLCSQNRENRLSDWIIYFWIELESKNCEKHICLNTFNVVTGKSKMGSVIRLSNSFRSKINKQMKKTANFKQKKRNFSFNLTQTKDKLSHLPHYKYSYAGRECLEMVKPRFRIFAVDDLIQPVQ